jgi:hypothetical protein
VAALVAKLGADQAPGVTSQSAGAVVAVAVGVAVASGVAVLVGALVAVLVGAMVAVLVGAVVGVLLGTVVGVLVGDPPPLSSSLLQPTTGAARLARMNRRTHVVRTLRIVIALILRLYRPTRSRMMGGTTGREIRQSHQGVRFVVGSAAGRPSLKRSTILPPSRSPFSEALGCMPTIGPDSCETENHSQFLQLQRPE